MRRITKKRIVKLFALLFSIIMLGSSLQVFAAQMEPGDRSEEPSLKEIYAEDFLMGNIYSGTQDYTNETRNTIFNKHFNAITMENAMKPQYLSPSKGVYNFENADILVDAAIERGMSVIGHTLCWHSQSAPWLNTGSTGETRELAKANLEEYIKNVCEHFRGRVISWDVVNEFFMDGIEVFPEGANWRDYSRTSGQNAWRRAYANGMNAEAGETDTDFLYDAFVFARKYDPDAKLYYNDFNLYQAGKADAVVQMVTELNAKYKAEHPEDTRLLIEGVGMQSHNYIQDTPASSVEASIKKFAELGVKVSVTELDLFCFFPWNAEPIKEYIDLKDRTASQLVGSNGTPEQKNYWANRGVTTGAEVEKIQAELYAEYFLIYKKYAEHIERVTFWGVRDNDSWRRGHNPLLWNSDYSKKEAFWAVADPEGYLKPSTPSGLELTSNKAGVISKGEYFNITATLTNTEQSNTSSITFTYDPAKYVYRSFTEAEGLTKFNVKKEEGIVTIILGNLNSYDLKSVGTALFSAREDVDLTNEDSTITARLDYVIYDNSQKVIKTLTGSLSFWTVEKPGDTDGDRKITLLDLSNLIDYFGVTSVDQLWATAKFFDFNHNGQIDINDISFVAVRIE